MTRSNPFAGCAPPPAVKPIDRCERGQYETNKQNGNTNTATFPASAWEASAVANSNDNSVILAQAGSLMFFNAVFSTAVVVPVWILLYDIDPKSAPNAVVPTAIARYSFGPAIPSIPDPAAPTVSSGAAITYEAQAEQVYNSRGPGRQDPNNRERGAWSFGVPFNFGIAMVASAGPRVYVPFGELVTLEWCVTARFQT